MEKEQGPEVRPDMIEMNPEFAGEFARTLMELERLRETRKQLELKSAQIMARVDKLMRDLSETRPTLPN